MEKSGATCRLVSTAESTAMSILTPNCNAKIQVDYSINTQTGSLKIREDSVNSSLLINAVGDGRVAVRTGALPKPRAVKIYASALAEDRDGRAMHNGGFVTAQEEDDAGDLFRLGPLGKIGIRHGLPIGFRINDARQD